MSGSRWRLAGSFAGNLADRLVGVATGPSLRGRRVVVRPLRVSDFPAWSEVRLRCGEWLTRWEPRRPMGSADPALDRRAYELRCEARDKERASGASYGFGVFVDERFVGEVNINGVVRGATQSANIGYWVDEAMAGRGYTPEAVVVLLRYAFEDLGLHRIEIAIVPRNAASRRVPAKLGLRAEGVASGLIEINGAWEDHVRYAITAEEWTQRRGELLRSWVEGD